MIESLSISQVATYGNQSEVLNGLSKLNFIFGSNGSGKTTISRVIAEADGHQHCRILWKDGTKLQAMVYNSDFVDANFNQSGDIKGVFTLGEEQVETLEKITASKSELEALEDQRQGLRKTLNGGNESSGKNGDLKTLDDSFKHKCWEQKQRYDANLKGAFEGCRNSADKFKSRVLQESVTNTAALVPLAALERRAETVFDKTPSREALVISINVNSLIAPETDSVLGRRILGKADVDIAGMINKLGNSDWVRQGRRFYDVTEGVCPFCQQDTEDDFAKSLAEYFDETFEADSQVISALEVSYKTDSVRLQESVASIISSPSRFLDIDKLKLEKQLLDSVIAGNLQILASKKKEPSQVVEMKTTANVLIAIKSLIDQANAAISEHNATVDNITQEHRTLTAQSWQFILAEMKSDLADYNKRKSGLDSAIGSLNGQIATKDKKINKKEQKIRELEKQITSIQPTVDEINALLKSFGFHGFSLASTSGDRYYKLVRADGSDAKNTLSEGERTFVTFLYFYHLLKGSNSESGITDNRVVVFDDPVSSLDSDILFIVSTLIRGLFDDVKCGNGYIKQIFLLTHNVYFHKEVSFSLKRASDRALTEETFWIVRKEGLLSKLINHRSNPVKTSYELLWADVKAPPKSSLTIQNTLRRILENYFKILGGINPDDICAKFEGHNKFVCKSLFAWVNDGSHSVHDDIYVSNGDTTVETYLAIFKKIFYESGHSAHYQMMMGENSELEVA
ncbi:Wobble nucleotide-excising tRNase [Marinobacter sp. LV10R510-11A]|uniref:AAA family ATPase n=1 Tax=Marinobacter sp. LV10R510-11A TaxID=1415568 RepID=UPI000BB96988|nr:AAA family ATPase [Marinobacter sp. LV10R510-11A]SOB78126.1 Wobble nucleotide-excising tRNase [Marinobacter sp. LV10R510-11A]